MHETRLGAQVLMIPLLTSLIGCSQVTVDNAPGRPSQYGDTREPFVSTLGIDSQDIVRATSDMVADILGSPDVMNHSHAPRIVVDDRKFENLSDDPMDKGMFADRLRTELKRASGNRLMVLARHHADVDAIEKHAESEGVVTPGTQGPTQTAYGYDYLMGGKIRSLSRHDAAGRMSRYYQITFELSRRGTLELAWTKMYEFKKIGQEPIYHR